MFLASSYVLVSELSYNPALKGSDFSSKNDIPFYTISCGKHEYAQFRDD